MITAVLGNLATRAASSPKVSPYSRRLGTWPCDIRSLCRRNMYNMSVRASTSSSRCDTVTGQWATSGGSKVGGATNTTFAPSMLNALMLLRATRLCLMSPTIVSVRPSKRSTPSAWRTVKQSTNA